MMSTPDAGEKRGVKSGYVDVGDLKVYYEEQGEGPPVVLVHGGLATGQMMWSGQMPALAERYRVLAPDSRGHGRTDNPAGKLSYSRMANDVAGFIDALALDLPMIVGYSDGAQIAIEFGLRHPDRVKAMVIGGAITEPTTAYLEGLHGWGFTEPGAVDLEQLKRSFGDFFATIQTAHAHVYGPDYWRPFLGQISDLWLTVPSYSDEQLARIPTPSLIIMGDRDDMGGLDQALRLYRTMPHAELAIIPNADHGAVARPLFREAVGDFLARHA